SDSQYAAGTPSGNSAAGVSADNFASFTFAACSFTLVSRSITTASGSPDCFARYVICSTIRSSSGRTLPAITTMPASFGSPVADRHVERAGQVPRRAGPDGRIAGLELIGVDVGRGLVLDGRLGRYELQSAELLLGRVDEADVELVLFELARDEDDLVLAAGL